MKPQISAASAVALTTLTYTTAWGLPNNPHSLSFALAWVLFMLLGALPLSFIEAAIVRRTRALPLQGLAPLTRDSDAPTFWRVLAPLSLLTLIGLIAFAARHSTQGVVVDVKNDIAVHAFPYLLVFLAMGFASVGTRLLLPFVSVLVPAVLALNAISTDHIGTVAALTPGEWRLIAGGALLSSLSTLGVYAWLTAQNPDEEHASRTVMPLWLVQTLVGLVAIVVGSVKGNISLVLYMLSAVFACAVLAEIVSRQLMARNLAKPVALGGVMLAAAAATAAADYIDLKLVIKVLGFVTMLGYAILLGWVAKISHVRKALNFGSEGVYNLWRVGVRVVAPLLVLWLLVGLGMDQFMR